MREDKFKGDLMGKMFTKTVFKIWNELPEELVKEDNITMFKRHFRAFNTKAFAQLF